MGKRRREPAAHAAAEALPNCPRMERAVLGCANVRFGEAMQQLLSSGVSEGSFYVPAHRILWRHYARFFDQTVEPDVPLLVQALEDSGELEAVGGAAGLADLYGSEVTLTLLPEYTRELLKVQREREIARASKALWGAHTLPGASEVEKSAALAGMAQALQEQSTANHGELHQREITQQLVQETKQLILQGHTIMGRRTGYQGLDHALGGLRTGGGYYLLAARPGVGKTAFGLNVARQVAQNSLHAGDGHEVLFITLEMSPLALNMRMLTAMLGCSREEICACHHNLQMQQRISAAILQLSKLPIRYLTNKLSAEKLAAAVHARCRSGKVSLVVVDYLQLLRSEHAGEGSRVDDLERVSGVFRELAQQITAPVLALAQVNRAADKSADKRPSMADVKGSGAFEQDAEAVMLLHRPELHESDTAKRAELRGKAELIIDKNRNGECCSLPFHWDGPRQNFTESDQ